MRLGQLSNLLAGFRYRFTDERDLQDGIERVLRSSGLPYRREPVLSAPDRPDFLVGDLAIEVKIQGTLPQLLRQVSRYATHDEVRGILVVGTPVWLAQVPDEIVGKPMVSLRLLGSLL